MRFRSWPCLENRHRETRDLWGSALFGSVALILGLSALRATPSLIGIWLTIGGTQLLTRLLQLVVSHYQENHSKRLWRQNASELELAGGPLRFMLYTLEIITYLLAAIVTIYGGFFEPNVHGSFRWWLATFGLFFIVDSIRALIGLIVWHGVDPRIEVDPEGIRVISVDARPWMARWKDLPYAEESRRGNRIVLTDSRHPSERVSMNGVPATHLYLQHLLDHFRIYPEDTAALGTPEGLDILKRITG